MRTTWNLAVGSSLMGFVVTAVAAILFAAAGGLDIRLDGEPIGTGFGGIVLPFEVLVNSITAPFTAVMSYHFLLKNEPISRITVFIRYGYSIGTAIVFVGSYLLLRSNNLDYGIQCFGGDIGIMFAAFFARTGAFKSKK